MKRTRKPLISADLVQNQDSGTVAVENMPPTTFPGGSLTLFNTDATPLVGTSTPCRFVWVFAPCDDSGVPTNAKVVRIGDVAGQNGQLIPSNLEGFEIAIDDASKLYIKAAQIGDAVNYRIFQ